LSPAARLAHAAYTESYERALDHHLRAARSIIVFSSQAG